MQLDQGSEKPIFIQLAEFVEDNILKGIYEEETRDSLDYRSGGDFESQPCNS